MIYRHHIFTIPSCFPVGHFVSEVRRWTGLPSGEVLGVLKGAAPISRSVGAWLRLGNTRRAALLTGVEGELPTIVAALEGGETLTEIV